MSLMQGISSYYQLNGVKGLLIIVSYRIFGRPKEMILYPINVSKPICLRIRTSDILTYKDILLGKEFEVELPFVPRHIVDCGANIGLASIFFANKYPEARIIAIEPEASNFAVLVRNTSDYQNIFPINAALWKEDGELGLSGSNKFAFQVCQGKGVRAISMKTLMQETELDCIDLFKIDIEGAEKRFLNLAI